MTFDQVIVICGLIPKGLRPNFCLFLDFGQAILVIVLMQNL